MPTFWRFTTSCLSVGSSEAGLFSDMVADGGASEMAVRSNWRVAVVQGVRGW